MIELVDLLNNSDYSSEKKAFLRLYRIQKKLGDLRTIFLTLAPTGLVDLEGSPLGHSRTFQHSSEVLKGGLVDMWAVFLSGKDDVHRARASFSTEVLESLVKPYLDVLGDARQKVADSSEETDVPAYLAEVYGQVSAQISGIFASNSISILSKADITGTQLGYLFQGFKDLQGQDTPVVR